MKAQSPSVRHVGPMAQDFHAAFGLGGDDKHINTVDADGVALAAIQGLHQIVQEQQTELDKKQRTIGLLQKQVEALRIELDSRLRAMEEALSWTGQPFPLQMRVSWRGLPVRAGSCAAPQQTD